MGVAALLTGNGEIIAVHFRAKVAAEIYFLRIPCDGEATVGVNSFKATQVEHLCGLQPESLLNSLQVQIRFKFLFELTSFGGWIDFDAFKVGRTGLLVYRSLNAGTMHKVLQVQDRIEYTYLRSKICLDFRERFNTEHERFNTVNNTRLCNRDSASVQHQHSLFLERPAPSGHLGLSRHHGPSKARHIDLLLSRRLYSVFTEIKPTALAKLGMWRLRCLSSLNLRCCTLIYFKFGLKAASGDTVFRDPRMPCSSGSRQTLSRRRQSPPPLSLFAAFLEAAAHRIYCSDASASRSIKLNSLPDFSTPLIVWVGSGSPRIDKKRGIAAKKLLFLAPCSPASTLTRAG
ncbi:hypothetical protein C8R43DRAFT_1136812 [Mycena crocata]|nr:hypothetical protein C8R43DRAFT_1136812 [Mycena crocata]